jgi:Tfp pilus assembly protein PilX
MIGKNESNEYRTFHPSREWIDQHERLWQDTSTWIELHELARRIGVKVTSLQATVSRRPESFPFEPVHRGASGKRYYDRAEVEAWIARGAPTANGFYRLIPKEAA